MRLARIDSNERLILCEAMKFDNGRAAIDTALRRASVSGHVEIEGNIANHFADLLDDNGNLVGTVSLDAQSYRALKNKWMRCKVQRAHS
jgi:hypothetical protein